jgi:hypothetical protein
MGKGPPHPHLNFRPRPGWNDARAPDLSGGGAGAGWGADDPSSLGMSRISQLSWLSFRIPIRTHLPDMTPSEAQCFSPENPRLGMDAALAPCKSSRGAGVCFWGGALHCRERCHCLAPLGMSRGSESHERQVRSAERERKGAPRRAAYWRAPVIFADSLTSLLAG